MGSDDLQRRYYPRVNKLCFISYVNREGDVQKTPVSLGRTLNISISGVGMEVYQELAVDSFMEMEIAVNEGTIISVTGTVVHITPADNGTFYAGIKFDVPRSDLGTPSE